MPRGGEAIGVFGRNLGIASGPIDKLIASIRCGGGSDFGAILNGSATTRQLHHTHALIGRGGRNGKVGSDHCIELRIGVLDGCTAIDGGDAGVLELNLCRADGSVGIGGELYLKDIAGTCLRLLGSHVRIENEAVGTRGLTRARQREVVLAPRAILIDTRLIVLARRDDADTLRKIQVELKSSVRIGGIQLYENGGSLALPILIGAEREDILVCPSRLRKAEQRDK